MELPKAFEERMRRLLGEEYEDFRAAYEQPEAQALRVNTGKLSKEAFLSLAPFSLERVPWTRNGFYYGKEDRPGRHVYHEAGLYYMQEPSAMAVGELAGARPGERVLSLCAAPGGKTTHLASDMKSVGLLVSNEIHPAQGEDPGSECGADGHCPRSGDQRDAGSAGGAVSGILSPDRGGRSLLR